MGRWTYYSPFFVGILLVFGVHTVVLEHPLVQARTAWGQWTLVTSLALALGVVFQTFMLGAQGAFAQVLPVAGGRSIRGRAAVVAGVFIDWAAVLLLVAGLLASESAGPAASIAILLSVVAGAIAIVVYFWYWPTAVRDFDDRAA